VKRSEHGFSLIELIIAMCIVFALLAMATPYAIGWLRGAKYREAAGGIVGVLREARNTAIARNRECRVEFDVDGDGRRWRVMLGNLAYGSTSFGVLRDWNTGELKDYIVLRGDTDCAGTDDVNLVFNPNGTVAVIAGKPTDPANPDYPYSICVMDSASSPVVQKQRVRIMSLTTGRIQVD